MSEAGQMVEYIDKNRVCMGLVQVAKQNRLNLLTSGDREVALSQNRVLLAHSSPVGPPQSRGAQVEYMRQREARRQELAQSVNVAELWELVFEETEPLPLKDLAELVFGSPVDADHQSATLRALFDEHLHFRLAGDQFLPLTAEQLEQKRLQEEREEAHRQQVDQAVGFLRRLPAQGPCPAPTPELARLLTDLVVFEDDAPNAKLAKEIASLAELGGRKKLFKLLVRLGVLAPHHNLELLRQEIPVEFAPEVEAEARSLYLDEAAAAGREDLTDLYTFTIDGAFTTDFDDALSFEPLPNGGGVLGVHIADAGALLPLEGVLDQEGRARGSSIYLPDQRIPMLPPTLSEDLFSLRQGELRPTISCLATIDDQGQVVDYRLARSLLKVHRRLTYDETDDLLVSDARLAGLYRVCQGLRQRREEAGAFFLPLPEVLVGVDEQGQVWVRRVDRDGPSREMVAETAILANWLFARFLQERGAPCLYRTQAAPKEAFQHGAPEDIFLHFSQRRKLHRVELVTKPGMHASLGVEPYTHATSPIRRYLDLVVQRQLGALLRGDEPLYSQEALERVGMETEPNVRRGAKVRQARVRYWLLVWLKERLGQKLPAIVMEKQFKKWQLLLTDIMVLATIPENSGQDLAPGQAVEVVLDKVDPFEDVLRIRLA